MSVTNKNAIYSDGKQLLNKLLTLNTLIKAKDDSSTIKLFIQDLI